MEKLIMIYDIDRQRFPVHKRVWKCDGSFEIASYATDQLSETSESMIPAVVSLPTVLLMRSARKKTYTSIFRHMSFWV